MAQFERLEQIVKLRQQIAKLYDEAFDGTDFEPQITPEGYSHAYFTYCVKSPFENTQDWLNFYNHHEELGGDDFYGMMQPSYFEPIMIEMGYAEKYRGKCPVAENVQKRSMLFKTNYRTVEEANKHIDVLKMTLKDHSEGKFI
jgi:dTDP-4-amino-4,6-dideoxygalactose transaminase